MLKHCLSIFFFLSTYILVLADCTITIANNTTEDMTNLSWSGGGCTPWPGSPSGNFTGNVTMNIGNNSVITIDTDWTITGNLIIDCNQCTIIIPVGITLDVSGDMGDANNNGAAFQVDGTLIVGGTFSGKNTNAFSGSGSITADTMDFGENTVCTPDPCEITFDVDNCNDPGNFCENVVPITLVYFEGLVQDNIVRLEWATAIEDNFDHFTVERSQDVKEFIELGDIPGKGGFNQITEYSYIDEAPQKGINYYRLKATDYDGFVEHHKIIGVNFDGDVKTQLIVYPNPSSANLITVRMPVIVEHGLLQVTDMMGRMLLQKPFSGLAQTIQIPGNPGKGTFIIKVQSESASYLGRLVLIK